MGNFYSTEVTHFIIFLWCIWCSGEGLGFNLTHSHTLASCIFQYRRSSELLIYSTRHVIHTRNLSSASHIWTRERADMEHMRGMACVSQAGAERQLLSSPGSDLNTTAASEADISRELSAIRSDVLPSRLAWIALDINFPLIAASSWDTYAAYSGETGGHLLTFPQLLIISVHAGASGNQIWTWICSAMIS